MITRSKLQELRNKLRAFGARHPLTLGSMCLGAGLLLGLMLG